MTSDEAALPQEAADRSLRELQRNWDGLARHDAMWAVLSDPAKFGRRWDRDEFFASGRAEIADLRRYMASHLAEAVDLRRRARAGFRLRAGPPVAGPGRTFPAGRRCRHFFGDGAAGARAQPAG